MPKLTDMQIRAWIKAGERFEGRSDGNGLYLSYRENYKTPVWRFRYKFAGKSRAMLIGSYAELSLARARETAKELSARVALGYDVAGEKQERKAEALAKIEAKKSALYVSELAAEYFERQILPRWKHPDILRRRIDKDINPCIGRMRVEDVKPRHIDDMLKGIVDRGAPTIATDVLRWTRRIFDYGIKRHALEINPCSAFEVSDAGGKEIARDRWLNRSELIKLFQAMRKAKGFSRQNELTFKLLLALCVRKMELCAARWEEFDLDAAIWHLPEERSKNGDAIDIPLPLAAVEWLKELLTFSCNSAWVLPARKMQHRMIPHIQESTLPVALAKVRAEMPDVPNFTIHDFRRTARTHLAALGVDPVVAERCLNHKIKGVEGIYNRHQYFNERKAALNLWADLLLTLEQGEDYNVTPIKKAHKLS
ncbi:site-specific integrase [Salmonella enterica subsp. enterica serovar Mikawasima]|uniref:Site-specific integrase n=1 Tax=Salmonella enterica subsp. enterica serovar Mikawasima TaxID=149388 RepID=A0A5H5X9L4_SALET|nr:site-specific integrase [Salmonella enterica subsp. enterica serovar Mikawasima]EAA5973570.1 site-specific integrase [Salmonella enterica subsp. enterica serovar Napoli]EAB8694310.1 site-specific integrase [Salmonella enterica]ECJ2443319.1 tyrosine-type recombinase/integrase [Salmonella enterica subsp. diarizonae]EDH3710330.1 tyrosine-type recombinase/integrase [Salmonella enterica subsp. enterica]EHG1404460.1 tyrosine-type recombinase/integrase [Salmonella enterica subsp. enterica serovar 